MARRRRNKCKPECHFINIDQQSESVVLVYKRHVEYFTNGDWTKAPGVELWRAIYELTVWIRSTPEELHELLFRV